MTYLRNHGAHPKYYHKIIGGNFRLDALQAAVLNVKLNHLDSWTEERQKNAAYYNEGFRQRELLEHINLPIALPGYRHIYNQYVIRTARRDALLNYLRDHQIGCEIYYPVTFNNQECFKYLGYNKNDFPEAEKAAEQSLAIPIYPELSAEQRDLIMDRIDEFFS
jgi:dTDP-4-amino-4,6-dideoxygalactose transaminase